MSWDVTLRDAENGKPIVVERHEEGGTYVVGGSLCADLNVTYNYGRVYHRVLGHNLIDALDGQRAGDTIPMLRRVVEACGTERAGSYWQPTRGNAGYAASILLGWAESNPDAEWDAQ